MLQILMDIQQYYHIVDFNIQMNTLQINIFVNIALVLILGGGGGVQLPVFGGFQPSVSELLMY